jgi:bifunctional ADP-heptose synthase (sugar kinase/adenylyltransferase)
LRRALGQLGAVDAGRVLTRADRFTPTYTKPMLQRPGEPPRELNRLDIKNRTPLPTDAEAQLVRAAEAAWGEANAVIILDQVSEADCGVVTARVRRRLGELGQQDPGRPALADSRERIRLFDHLWLKPNGRECRQAVPGQDDVAAGAAALAKRVGCPVFCTVGEAGMIVADPRGPSLRCTAVPAYPVSGPIDVVGAGDSCNAGLACALAAGCSLEEAAAFGNLVASVTIRQIGTTGTASPGQVRGRWAEVRG